MQERTVKIEFDQSLHPGRQPENEGELIVWAALDTAWNVLRDAAVQSVIQRLRETAAEHGIEFAETDEELFAEIKAYDPEVEVTCYRSIAPDHPVAQIGLANVFDLLEKTALEEARDGFRLARKFQIELDGLTGEA